jgi:hypothetical protein
LQGKARSGIFSWSVRKPAQSFEHGFGFWFGGLFFAPLCFGNGIGQHPIAGRTTMASTLNGGAKRSGDAITTQKTKRTKGQQVSVLFTPIQDSQLTLPGWRAIATDSEVCWWHNANRLQWKWPAWNANGS